MHAEQLRNGMESFYTHKQRRTTNVTLIAGAKPSKCHKEITQRQQCQTCIRIFFARRISVFPVFWFDSADCLLFSMITITCHETRSLLFAFVSFHAHASSWSVLCDQMGGWIAAIYSLEQFNAQKQKTGPFQSNCDSLHISNVLTIIVHNGRFFCDKLAIH